MRYFKAECGADAKCFIYKGVDELNSGQKLFLDMLDINGYIIRTKVVKKIKDHHGGYRTAVLLSGDSDFALPIDKIKSAGKRIIVMSTRGHISRELLEIAKYVDLRKIRSEIQQ